ncbi:MAG: Maf family nucleotide pyrophosphatase [Flavobacteriia bacterium]|nr:Maf family nucleotide pyrophosphatase [Flavobacteriia bacterium]
MPISFPNIQLVLASGSPRRQQFFKDMGFEVLIRLKEVAEMYPDHLEGAAIPLFLADLKAKALKDSLATNELLITSDTIVWNKGQALGKPTDKAAAVAMLESMSAGSHEVHTAVCFSYQGQQHFCTQETKVRFKELSDAEINYYVDHYKPYDKAGAYGIQEWIGLIGITHIEGSYNNVVGLPTQLVYSELSKLLGTPELE